MINSISLVSSSAIPTDRGSRLLVRATSRFTGPNDVLVQWTQENTDGSIQNNSQIVTIPAASRSVEQALPLTDGRLLRVTAWQPGLSFPPGQTYIQLALQSGDVTRDDNILYLNSGYVSAGATVQYPPEQNDGALIVGMMPTLEQVSDPSAGSGWSFNPIGTSFGQFTSFRCTFTADANAANRTIHYTIRDANGDILDVLGATAITANQERIIQGWSGPNRPADNATVHYLPFPENLWPSSPEIAVTADNIQVGDTFTFITVGFQFNRLPAF